MDRVTVTAMFLDTEAWPNRECSLQASVLAGSPSLLFQTLEPTPYLESSCPGVTFMLFLVQNAGQGKGRRCFCLQSGPDASHTLTRYGRAGAGNQEPPHLMALQELP